MNNRRCVCNCDHHQNQIHLNWEFSELNTGDSVLHRGPVMPFPPCWNVTSSRLHLNSRKRTWYWFTGRVWRGDEGNCTWNTVLVIEDLWWGDLIVNRYPANLWNTKTRLYNNQMSEHIVHAPQPILWQERLWIRFSRQRFMAHLPLCGWESVHLFNCRYTWL